MAAVEPVPATCWPSCSSSRWTGSKRPVRVGRLLPEGEPGLRPGRVAGGYRYQTHPDMAPFVERFALEGVSSRLSSAALESLAIIAYRQPVSRGQIAALRGVNVDGVVRLLEQRGYIAAVGHAGGPGSPFSTGPPRPFWRSSVWPPSTSCPRSRISCPDPTPWRNSRSACVRAPMPEREPARAEISASDPSEQRLQKVLARVGLGSRRVVRGADRRRTGEGERREGRPRPTGRPGPRPDRARRGAPAAFCPGSSTTC